MAAIERYRIVRKYASGVVADAACGCGYGSWMLSRCPSVDRVIGLDADEESIAFARLEYPAAFINFATCDLQGPGLTDVLTGSAVDTVVSVETVEHLAEPDRFVRGVLASRASRLILTFPAFVTSTFNPYHLSDVSLARSRGHGRSAGSEGTDARRRRAGGRLRSAVSDLTFVCCAFNEARQLPMMLATLPRGARVVVIDGASTVLPHEVPWSTDGTLGSPSDLVVKWCVSIGRGTTSR